MDDSHDPDDVLTPPSAHLADQLSDVCSQSAACTSSDRAFWTAKRRNADTFRVDTKNMILEHSRTICGRILHLFKNIIAHKNSLQVFNRFNIYFSIVFQFIF